MVVVDGPFLVEAPFLAGSPCAWAAPGAPWAPLALSSHPAHILLLLDAGMDLPHCLQVLGTLECSGTWI